MSKSTGGTGGYQVQKDTAYGLVLQGSTDCPGGDTGANSYMVVEILAV